MRNNRGFVLVELLMDGVAVGALLVVLVLMGVQSVMAIPRLAESRDQTHLAALRWDLENLRAHQALHFADNRAYASHPDDLSFNPTEGVTLRIVASAWGWSATATHERLGDDRACGVYVGTALPPAGPVTPARRGQVSCSE